ncbi:MAG: acyl-CoA thioesterase [Cyanobacteria bacterium P01_A01_bin.105]
MFIYPRTIRFHETDAAGVVYFANVLTLCHEAYEASLAAAAVNIRSFFNGQETAVPVVHASVDFCRPIGCGDAIAIHLTPLQTAESAFEIAYRLHLNADDQPLLAQAVTRHVCLQTSPRQRTVLTPELIRWIVQWSGPALADG